MRWDYPPLDINPIFAGLGEIIIVIIIIIIIINSLFNVDNLVQTIIFQFPGKSKPEIRKIPTYLPTYLPTYIYIYISVFPNF